MSSLHDDILLDVLARLPAKSVARFRCVSKQWLSLTTDPQFIKTHSSVSPISPSSFYICDSRDKVELVHVDGNNQTSSTSSYDPCLSFLDFRGFPPVIVDSCNGLILCCLPCKLCDENQPFILSVCNPTTREHDVIYVSDKHPGFPFYLAFDPSVSPYYKVICLMYREEGHEYCTGAYSSQTRSWTRLDGTISAGFETCRGVFWKGSLCWMASSWNCILCLDLETEKYSRMPLPAVAMKYVDCIGQSEGRLHCITASDKAGLNYNDTRYDIFETESKSSGWSLLYHVDVDDAMAKMCPKKKGRYVPLGVLWFVRRGRRDDDVGDRLLLRIPFKIVAYHLKDKTFSTIQTFCRRYDYSWKQIYPHAYSLFPMNASTSHQDWVCWTSKYDGLLISLMVEQSLNGQKTGLDFKQKAWDDMLEKFNGATQLKYEVYHLEERFLSYKREYKAAKQLLSKGVLDWNPWQEMVLFKRKLVPYRDLEIICAPSVTGCRGVTSFSDDTATKRNEKEDVKEEFSEETRRILPLKRKRKPREVFD